MPSNYKTPGAYIQEISRFPPSVAEVETAIPAFIGYTEKANVRGIDYHALMATAKPLQKAVADANTALANAKTARDNAAPVTDQLKRAATDAETALNTAQRNLAAAPKPVAVRITSLLEYRNFFGEAEKETMIQVAIAESGEATVTIPTPSEHNMFYSLQAFFANGGGPCYIVSVGPTSQEDKQSKKKTETPVELVPLTNGLTAIEKEDEVTLIVCPESLALSNSDFNGFYTQALDQCNRLQDRFVVMDAKLDDKNMSIFDAASTFRSDGIGNNNLKYGAAYAPRVETIFDYQYNEEDVVVDVSQLKLKDKGGNPIAPPTPNPNLAEINPEKQPPPNPPSNYGQYYPVVKSAIAAKPVVLPAAPLVVGVYAAVDNDRGVWKAPANVSLSAVVGPTIKISSAEQENLNLDTTGKSINAIRSFTGKGTLIWGARTLAGNDNEWRYIPVRRFFIMAEESIKKATEGFVFEPNDSNTWTKVRSMIENFLLLQWRARALQGAKPEQSFYVKIGLNETMTALDILEGRMIIEIGMAVVRPAEFIILKFSHKMAES